MSESSVLWMTRHDKPAAHACTAAAGECPSRMASSKGVRTRASCASSSSMRILNCATRSTCTVRRTLSASSDG